MYRFKTLTTAFALSTAVALSAAADFPERAITIVVPFAPGGATDVVARVMASQMALTLKQPVVIENLPGAGGTVGSNKVAKAKPDGYTLLMGSLGTQVASVGLYPKLPYDPKKDFEPVMNVVFTPMVISVRKGLPVKDFKEFVAMLKDKGASLNFGSGGAGSQSHLLCMYLAQITGTNPTHVPYRGSGPAMAALLAQEVDFTCDQTIGVMPYIATGAVKPLAVARRTRVAVMPTVPTSAEEGLPAFDADGWISLFAPHGTPRAVITTINNAGRAALRDESVRKRLQEMGNEIPTDAELSPAALNELVTKESDKWLPLIKKSGVVAE